MIWCAYIVLISVMIVEFYNMTDLFMKELIYEKTYNEKFRNNILHFIIEDNFFIHLIFFILAILGFISVL